MGALTAAAAGMMGEMGAEQAADEERVALFRRLASGQLGRAYRLAGLLLGNAIEAEDATQDAFVRAWRSLGSLRDPADGQAWFDRILVNVCRDRLRQRRLVRFVPIEGETPGPVDADAFRRVLDRDAALRAIGVLEADERLVVVLHYWGDLPISAVATRLGVPAGTVKSRLSRALARMERALVAAGEGTDA